MSSIFDNKKNKSKCQKFTPANIVDSMLDMAGYTKNLSGKRILENSFGTGNILKAIVTRYIKDSLIHQIPPQTISKNISRDIYGIELDNSLYLNCINDLNSLIDSFGLPPVNWSLFNEDALTHMFDFQFDFIVGNPPYITYRDIDSDSKKYIRENYSTCAKGKFDYCYAFIETGIKLLNDTGKLVQLIPSNIYKNVFADELRKLLKTHLAIVWEYPTKKMFGETLTSSSIFLFDKTHISGDIEYKNITEKIHVQIPCESLTGKWVFRSMTPFSDTTIRFGDHFHASIAVATLLNQAFVIKKDEKANSLIEDEILRPAAAPKALRFDKEEYIIFPYYYTDDGLCHFDPDEFENKYPLAVQHLKQYRTKLENRDADETAYWFEYGRSQALGHLNQEKLLLSTVVTNKVEVYSLDNQTVPYSGIYITVVDDEYSLEDAKRILQSNHFLEYVKELGISVSGKSKRITCRDINNFTFVKTNY